MNPDDIDKAIRAKNIHYPPTSLLCYENTHNRAGGTVVSLEISAALYNLGKKHGLAVHLDGARIFNAAIYLGIDVKELANCADSVMFCLSKGLSAPVGSMLAGSAAFIDHARHVRKMLGGGMRQAGVLAAAGIVALKMMLLRLTEDHRNARALATKIEGLPGVYIDRSTVQTNMVNMAVDTDRMPLSKLVSELRVRKILVSTRPPRTIRMVTHRHITDMDIDTTVNALAEILTGKG
jgi:threonine aldolase